MAQARKKSSAGGSKKGRYRGPLLLVLGVGIGVGGLYLGQLIAKRVETNSGIATLFSSAFKSADKPAEPPKKEKEAAKSGKPRYEFYTLLQNETVLPKGEPATRTTKPAARTEEAANYFLQVGSYASFEDADQLKARLALSGLVAHIQKVDLDGKTFHRVRIGPYEKREQLTAPAEQLDRLGIRSLPVKVKKSAG